MATIEQHLKNQAFHAMKQTRLRYAGNPVMERLAPPWAVRLCKSYREACRLAWMLRRTPNLTRISLATAVGLPNTRISDFLSPDDSGKKRDLPASRIAPFGVALGCTAVSQWMTWRGEVTVIEELKWAHENPDLIPTEALRVLSPSVLRF